MRHVWNYAICTPLFFTYSLSSSYILFNDVLCCLVCSVILASRRTSGPQNVSHCSFARGPLSVCAALYRGRLRLYYYLSSPPSVFHYPFPPYAIILHTMKGMNHNDDLQCLILLAPFIMRDASVRWA